MAQPEPDRQAEIREVLINAVEVQLAALKAAVSFWGEWMERTSAFVKTASKSLSTIRSADKDAGQVLLEVVDAGRFPHLDGWLLGTAVAGLAARRQGQAHKQGE